MRRSRMIRRGGTQRRRGFTLMEILLVMAILVVLGSLVTFSFITIRRNANSDASRLQIKQLMSACDLYQLRVNTFPSQLSDLTNLPQGMSTEEWGGPYLQEQIPNDPWRNPYSYSVVTDNNGNPRPLITSNGADMTKGTADDISSAAPTSG